MSLKIKPKGHLQVVVADFEGRSCPKDTKLRNENLKNDTARNPQCKLLFIELITGSCRPLRVLFIRSRFFHYFSIFHFKCLCLFYRRMSIRDKFSKSFNHCFNALTWCFPIFPNTFTWFFY